LIAKRTTEAGRFRGEAAKATLAGRLRIKLAGDKSLNAGHKLRVRLHGSGRV
jgi:hypothetical protein